jgi:hypothetical protein
MWVPVITAWRARRMWMLERPEDVEGNGEYIELALADSRQRVDL